MHFGQLAYDNTLLVIHYRYCSSGLERKAATPAGTARAEDPGLSEAREAAEAVPAERVRLERKSGV
ncbi:hypothetical protein [Sporosarcina saromensis]|uniref:hypothetical protein n=1 Tax=Sporosarcina saromensis TaxID=359365 RepID=UPI00295E87E6|nr:hypothetical protein [Sporosarcina saromensis]